RDIRRLIASRYGMDRQSDQGYLLLQRQELFQLGRYCQAAAIENSTMRVNIILTVLFSAWLQAGAQTAVTPPFPRLATIYSKTGAGVSQRTDEGKRVIAKFDLYIPTMNMWGGPCGNDSSCRGHAGMTIGQYLKFLNPHQMDLIYVHSAFFPRWSAPRDGRGYIVGDTSYYFDLRWLLTYAGTIMHGD